MIDLPLCGIFQNASAAAQGSLAEPAKARLAPNNVLSVVVLELFEEDESASKRPASNTLAPSVPSVTYSERILSKKKRKNHNLNWSAFRENYYYYYYREMFLKKIPYEIPTTQSYDIKVIKICLDLVTD